MLEPAGALALAGMKKYITQHDIEGRSFVAITSGANMKCKLHASGRVGRLAGWLVPYVGIRAIMSVEECPSCHAGHVGAPRPAVRVRGEIMTGQV